MRAATMVATSRIRRRLPGLVLLGVLAGVIGGLATGAIAGERRTDSAAERLIRATKAPDAFVLVRDPSVADSVRATIDAHPATLAVWPTSRFIGRTTDAKDWYYPLAGPERDADIYRPQLTEGRLPADDSTTEVAITAATADHTGLGVGDTIRMDLYTPDQMETIAEDTEVQPAGAHLDLRVVGVMRDAFDISTAASERFILGSPAFYATYGAGSENQFQGFAIRTRGGAAGLEEVADAVQRDRAPGTVAVESTADALASTRPASRVLRVGTWLLAATIVAIGSFALAQAIRRHVGGDLAEERSLRAIGFTRSDGTTAATIPGVVSAVAAMAVAVGVAVAVSPLFPLGRPRLLEPSPGISVNLGVLVLGAWATAVGTVALFAAMAWFDLRDRPRPHRREPSRLVTTLGAIAPPPMLLGLHLMTDPSRTRRGVSARTAIAGTAIGIAGLVASVTFSHSLHHLVSTPAAFGLDYDLAIEVPLSQVGARLDELATDPELSAVAEQWSTDVVVDGRATLGVSMDSTKGSIQPTVVSGRLPSGSDEIMLGPVLTRRLGIDVGDQVDLGSGAAARQVTVVGEMLDPQLISADYAAAAFIRKDTLAEVASNDPYPILAVRFAPGVDAGAKAADLDERYPFGVMDESFPSVPGSLENLDDVKAVPMMLAWFFGGLTVVALANGIVATGRRSRRLLGIVRGLGFTSVQVRRTVVTTGCAMAATAVVIGLPLGMVLGATTWSRVSTRVDIRPDVQWPIAVCLSVLPLAALVGAVASLWPAHGAIAPQPAAILDTD